MTDTITCQNIDLSYWINVYCLNDIKFLEVRYMFVYFFYDILNLGFVVPCNFKHSNKTPNQMQQSIVKLCLYDKAIKFYD
jgi:hypothetical protein